MRILKWLDEHLEEYVAVALLVGIFIAVILQIFMRYVLQDSLFWTEEVIRYMFIWLVFIGISFGVKKKNHIKISFLYDSVSLRYKWVLNLFSNAVFMVFCVIIGSLGVKELARFLEFSQVSPSLGLPMQWVYAAAPVGLGLAFIRLIQSSIETIKTRNEQPPAQDLANDNF